MIDVIEAAPSALTNHFANIYSQFGEDGVIAEVFRRIGTTNKQCFEVGAADGKWFSNTRRWIDDGWSAALIEANEKNWPELDKLDNPPRVHVVHGKAEAAGECSLDSILSQCGFIESMDLGVIDVDGQDYYLWNGMLKFRPRVMVVEFDPNADKNFVPDLGGEGQAGLAAICSVAVSKGYCNVAVTQTNLIFIRTTERDKFYREVAKSTPAEVSPPKAVQAKDLITSPPVLATGREKEIKICAILSRPRYGTSTFWDCASEALAPWHIPIQSFYGVFWGQCMQKAMEDNIAAGVDWILTLDYDSMFTSRHLSQLIDCLGQNPQIDAVSPLQVRRGRPLPLMVRSDGTATMTGGPIQAATAHFGLTLFRVEAIKKMAKPWFWSKPAPDNGWGEGRLDDDIYFWHQWREAGNSLFVHTGVRIGHIEEMVSEYDENYQQRHVYLTGWRQSNGHKTKVFD
jgi:hypothetical protein